MFTADSKIITVNTILTKVCLFLTFGLVLLFFPNSAFASENFETTLKTTYNVLESGNTRVTHEFQITNLKPLFTVTQYGMKISSTNIHDVTVLADGIEIPAEVVTTDNQTSIGITFPDKVVGQGKKRTFSITFTDPDAAAVSGQVLEVAIPKVKNADYAKYTVVIKTPLRFGPPSRVIPTTFKMEYTTTDIVTTFTDVQDQSIFALFGTSQLFDMTLRYTLENSTANPGITQIALPPDTPYQRMFYSSLDPLPLDMERDLDGNWIATYQLPANSDTVVLLNAQAQIHLEPDNSIPSLPPTERHVSGQEFWETQDDSIKTTAVSLNSTRDIYSFVVSNLDYNFSRLETGIERLGAATALAHPEQALCQEYTDVFVALARAKGIPSRRVTGYAHTENSILRPLSLVEDVLHAWPEYYDQEQQQWVPVDPTWDNTSGGINYFDQFDLNHVVFAFNGLSSVTPYPAGSYKSQDAVNAKDVEVSFGDTVYQIQPDFDFSVSSTSLASLALFNTQKLRIENVTGQAFYNQQVTIHTQDTATIVSPTVLDLDYVLPFQTREYPLSITSTKWLLPTKTQLIVTYHDQEDIIDITAVPKLWYYLTNPYVLVGLGAGCLGLAGISWGVLVLRRRRASALRRQSQKS